MKQRLLETLKLAALAAVSAFLAAFGVNWGKVGPGPIAPNIEPPDPLAAICRLSFDGVGCTATVIGPRRTDGRWNVLTAAHCTRGVGQRGQIQFRDGRQSGVVVKALNRQADCCWMVTDVAGADFPFAFLVEKTPAVGSPLWHAGFGVHVPANREDGELTGGANSDGQVRMRLSVSSGDSGGGIALTQGGEVCSCVCCTSERGRTADVYGASPEAIRRLLLEATSDMEWVPLDIPLKGP